MHAVLSHKWFFHNNKEKYNAYTNISFSLSLSCSRVYNAIISQIFCSVIDESFRDDRMNREIFAKQEVICACSAIIYMRNTLDEATQH